MEKERIREIVRETFAKTFDPVFTVRLLEFMKVYRADLIARHDWFREFGYQVYFQDKPKAVFDVVPLEELMITTISDKIYNEQNK